MSAAPASVLTPDKTAMRRHLDCLFGAVPPAFQNGLVEIAYAAPEDGAIRHARLFTLDALDDAVEFAAAVNAGEGFSVYVGAALRKPTTKRTARCGEKDFYAATSLWADLDDEEPVRAAGGRCDAAMPNLVLYSGLHPHMRTQLFWRLAEPVTAANDLRAALTAICMHLDGDEKVAEPARVMRLAGSIAWPHKEGRIPEMTGLIGIKRPGPESFLLKELVAAYSSPSNVLNFPETRKVTPFDRLRTTADPAATNEWGKLWDGREAAMRDFVWRWVVDLYRDAPIQPHEATSQEEMERAWVEFAKTITAREPGHTLEDEGRGETMFASKWRYAMRHWDTKVRDAAQVPPPRDAAGPAEEQAPIDPSAVRLLGWRAYRESRAGQDSIYLVKGLVRAGTVISINGRPGIGKTAVLVEMAKRLDAGEPFLGYETKQTAVCYIAAEDEADVVNRLEALELDDVMIVVSEEGVPLDKPDRAAAIVRDVIRQAQEKFPDREILVAYDTLRAGLGGLSVMDDRYTSPALNKLRKVAEDTGAVIAVSNHTNRENPKQTKGETLETVVALELVLVEAEGGWLEVHTGKSRSSPSRRQIGRMHLTSIQVGDVEAAVIDAVESVSGGGSHENENDRAPGTNQALILTIMKNVILDQGFPHQPFIDGPTVRAVKENALRKIFIERKGGENRDNKRRSFVQALNRLLNHTLMRGENADGEGVVWFSKKEDEPSRSTFFQPEEDAP